jgi:hypothetical protein
MLSRLILFIDQHRHVVVGMQIDRAIQFHLRLLPSTVVWSPKLTAYWRNRLDDYQVYFVELLASLEARIDREGTPFRASLKPNQEDVAAARARQVQFARQYKMNTDGKLPLAYPHLIIDTEAMSPSEAAAKIQATLGLVQSGA